MKQRAEVAAYFGRFDEAEAVYREVRASRAHALVVVVVVQRAAL